MKHLPRFTISDDNTPSETDSIVRLSGGELHHLRDVMKLGVGTEVVLSGANGREYAGQIVAFDRHAAIITVSSARFSANANSSRLILAAGIIKAARMDMLIEKAAELDAAEIWPLICHRSVVREPGSERQQRWRRIAEAASKQSLRGRPMEIHAPLPVETMVSRLPRATCAIVCAAGAPPLVAMIRRLANIKACPIVILAVGPEGDFTAEEMATMGKAGFVAAGLGANRLRSETAALAALSIVGGVLAELDELNYTA